MTCPKCGEPIYMANHECGFALAYIVGRHCRAEREQDLSEWAGYYATDVGFLLKQLTEARHRIGILEEQNAQ